MVQNVFVFGATGFVGGAVGRRFVERRFSVTGLARTDKAAARLSAAGIAAQIGDLDGRLSGTIELAAQADIIVLAAQLAPSMELATVKAILDRLADSGKTFVFLSGSGVLCKRTEGAWSSESFDEDDPFEPEPVAAARVEAEKLVRERLDCRNRLRRRWYGHSTGNGLLALYGLEDGRDRIGAGPCQRAGRRQHHCQRSSPRNYGHRRCPRHAE